MIDETGDRRRYLKDEAYSRLRALLLSGEFAPGSFLSERQLVAMLGMSKTPIRVAMERLAQDGFVEILAQRGVRVRELSLREVVEHYEVRQVLETWVVRRVAQRVSQDELAQMDELVSRHRELATRLEARRKRLDPARAAEYIELDSQLHRTLAAIAGNEQIVLIMAQQQQRIARVIANNILRHRRLRTTAIDEHERILKALKRGDADAAAREMFQHLERGRRQFIERATPEQRASLDTRSEDLRLHAEAFSQARSPSPAGRSRGRPGGELVKL